jgi:pyridoxal phosphate enzyme (YggS family)
MSVANNLSDLKKKIPPGVSLVAVSKTKPAEEIIKAYNAGQRIFGENKVQELCDKRPLLPPDIAWHLIGHLQTNKVKYIAPFISVIHAVDSLKLLKEINKEAIKNNRTIDCLLQIYIAEEETKFGLSYTEAEQLLDSVEFRKMENVRIIGLMGMATNTENEAQIRKEFDSIAGFFNRLKQNHPAFSILSIGMSSDYKIAIEAGSNMIRVGSLIFGER